LSKCCYLSCKWGGKKENKEGYAICHYLAFVAARTSHVGIRGIVAFV